MAACRYGHETIVEMLIKAGADVNDINGDSSPLEVALDYKNSNFSNNSNIFKILLKAGADVDHIIRKQSFLITKYQKMFNDKAKGIKAGVNVNL